MTKKNLGGNKMKLFDNLFDYVKDADISDYKRDFHFEGEQPKYVIAEVDIINDPDFYIGGYDNTKTIDGKVYKLINWGEDEKSYVLESEVKGQYTGRFWTIYMQSSKDKHQYHSIGQIYKSDGDCLKDIEEGVSYKTVYGYEG